MMIAIYYFKEQLRYIPIVRQIEHAYTFHSCPKSKHEM